MRIRVFTLRFDTLLGQFDDTLFQEFQAGKQIIDKTSHFFSYEGEPYLAIVVSYRSVRPDGGNHKKSNPSKEASDSWKKQISKEDYPLFNALREWRMERSKDEGVPPYIVCTNKQFASMISAKPSSLAQLNEIEGFGKKRLEKYGKDILEILVASRQER